jgi:prolipoprotein diacylglyceryltransferase
MEMVITFAAEPEINTKDYISNLFSVDLQSNLSNQPYFNEHIYVPENEPMPFEVRLQGNQYVAVADVYGIARHPTQLYESGTTLLIFFLLLFIWYRKQNNTPAGLLLGLFLILLFGLRFFHETFKENQVAFEDEMTYNLGQILSIPLIIAGIFILIRALKNSKTSKIT